METIKIGNKNYQISFIDTAETIKNMVAAKEKLPPRFIRFTKFNLVKKNFNIETIPKLLQNVEIGDLEKTIATLVQNWDVSSTDLALEWLKINYNGKLGKENIPVIDEFKKINPTDFWGHQSIVQRYEEYQKQYNKDLAELKKTVTKEEDYRKKYNSFTPVQTTKFLQDSVIVEYDITIDYDPLEAFDSISLTEMIPYAQLKTADQSYYKTLKTFTPSEDWLDSETTMMFKINQGDKQDWGTATINYTSAEEPYKAVMVIEVTISPGSKKNTTENTIKNALIGLFDGAGIKVVNREEKGIKGVFAVPEMVISKPILLDLITNEPMVSYYLYVDENRDLSSEKTVLYLYYSPGYNPSPDPDQILTTFLSDRIASRSDVFYNTKELPLFTPYLNVRISRAMNIDQINRFKTAFAIILDLYNKKFDNIVKEYKKMIPNFEATKQRASKKSAESSKKLKDLQKLDSELFIHGYPTNCEQKRQPIPIKKSEQAKLKKKGHQIMNYPKGSNNFFICGKENAFQYPGLLQNKLSNSDVYDYLPCCYTKNQRVGTKLLNRYEQNLIKTGAKTSNIVSKKIVRREKLGYLPRNIDYILHKNAKAGEKFYRQGVEPGNNSFLEAVMLALDEYYLDNMKTNEQKTNYVTNVRTNLAAIDTVAVIQELYDSDAEKITKDILDPEVVFDSKIFTGLLEAYWDCQIVVFSRTEEQPNGEFEIPRYTQGYLYRKLDPNKPTVLIYKHYGARSDNLTSPHYETIIKKYKKMTTWHLESDPLIRQIYSYFLRTYRLYSIGVGRYNAITIPPPKFTDAVGQYIDRYGKTRGYLFDKGVYIATSPLPPDHYTPMVDMPESRPTKKDTLAFIKKHSLKITQQDIVDNQAVGVKLAIPGIAYAYAPFEASSKLAMTSEGTHLGHSIPVNEDILSKTVENRKIADFMMQLLLYSFSIWYEEQQDTDAYQTEQDENSKLTIANRIVAEKNQLSVYTEDFLNTMIVIVSDHDYRVDELPRRLSLNNTFFQNNKLIVDSKNTFTKLGYYLRYMLGKNKKLVFQYSEKTYLDNYYTYAADFVQRNDQLLFIGRLSIDNWINTQNYGISNQVHSQPHVYLDTPYFFSHWALNGGKPVIIQNVKGGELQRALAVAVTYAKEKYNPGFNVKRIKPIDHSSFYLENGVLIRDGSSPIKVWKYADNYYGAIITP